MEPTPGSLADLQAEADPHQVARTIVLRLLNTAPKTREQLARALRSRGIADDVATEVLDRFVELGYINDRDFAAEWVRQRHEFKGLSRRRLGQELTQRGVSPDDQEQALGTIDDDQELTAARAQAARRFERFRELPDDVAARRLSGFLARRGYGSSVVMRVVRELVWGPDRGVNAHQP
jgi:regulatory protein